jgi:hypothetical protein
MHQLVVRGHDRSVERAFFGLNDFAYADIPKFAFSRNKHELAIGALDASLPASPTCLE